MFNYSCGAVQLYEGHIFQTITKEQPQKLGTKFYMQNVLFMHGLCIKCFLKYIHVTQMGIPHILKHHYFLSGVSLCVFSSNSETTRIFLFGQCCNPSDEGEFLNIFFLILLYRLVLGFNLFDSEVKHGQLVNKTILFCISNKCGLGLICDVLTQ